MWFQRFRQLTDDYTSGRREKPAADSVSFFFWTRFEAWPSFLPPKESFQFGQLMQVEIYPLPDITEPECRCSRCCSNCVEVSLRCSRQQENLEDPVSYAFEDLRFRLL